MPPDGGDSNHAPRVCVVIVSTLASWCQQLTQNTTSTTNVCFYARIKITEGQTSQERNNAQDVLCHYSQLLYCRSSENNVKILFNPFEGRRSRWLVRGYWVIPPFTILLNNLVIIDQILFIHGVLKSHSLSLWTTRPQATQELATYSRLLTSIRHY